MPYSCQSCFSHAHRFVLGDDGSLPVEGVFVCINFTAFHFRFSISATQPQMLKRQTHDKF